MMMVLGTAKNRSCTNRILEEIVRGQQKNYASTSCERRKVVEHLLCDMQLTCTTKNVSRGKDNKWCVDSGACKHMIEHS